MSIRLNIESHIFYVINCVAFSDFYDGFQWMWNMLGVGTRIIIEMMRWDYFSITVFVSIGLCLRSFSLHHRSHSANLPEFSYFGKRWIASLLQYMICGRLNVASNVYRVFVWLFSIQFYTEKIPRIAIELCTLYTLERYCRMWMRATLMRTWPEIRQE